VTPRVSPGTCGFMPSFVSCSWSHCVAQPALRPQQELQTRGQSVVVTVANECSGGQGKNASGVCKQDAFNLQPEVRPHTQHQRPHTSDPRPNTQHQRPHTLDSRAQSSDLRPAH